MSNQNFGLSTGPEARGVEGGWDSAPPRWGWADAVALAAWSIVIFAFFHEIVFMKRALFYFDVTEINFPYRDFFANELKAGRFSRWIPGLYCGHPLYSESQAGYLHPLKYVLYPWLPTWKAFGLDTVLSVWLAGVGTFCWLRRHMGRWGAWAGCAIFACSGYTWAHFIHTSMINALASVPCAVGAIELAGDGRRLRGVALGGLALACQVFAGHLQDVILTGSALAVYGGFRALTERRWGARFWAIGAVVLMGLTAVAVSAVQWIPSKELIDRSPRSGGLDWEDLTYGSWSPELLPGLLVREAFGTRARDTDWMDGFYPHLEMNTYVGVVGLLLALIGLGGARNRWVAFWPILAGLGVLLMLGKHTFLMDVFPHIPFINTGRIPVRYHLWFAIAIAALAAVGVDRLARVDCGRIDARKAVLALGVLALVSIVLMALIYQPVWTERGRWRLPYHARRYAWLGSELAFGAARTGALLAGALASIWFASRGGSARLRGVGAAGLCALAACDSLSAHAVDVPTVDPAYWTTEPETARWLKRQPDLERIFGERLRASGEPGYASEPIDFLAVRELLAWSLPPVWGLASTAGETPIIPRRRLRFTAHEEVVARFDVEGLSHVLAVSPNAEARLGPGVSVGGVTIHRNEGHLPRARLVGRPAYARDERHASALMKELDQGILDRLIVEDPTQPLPPDAAVSGSAKIVRDMPEHLIVEVNAQTPAYLFLADSYDPGWTARAEGVELPIRPAYAAFRAVYLPAGRHRVEFRYEPAGFRLGALVTGIGAVLVIAMLVVPWRAPELRSSHDVLSWSPDWPKWILVFMAAVLVCSVIQIGPGARVGVQERWRHAFHRFTWGAGIEAMRPPKPLIRESAALPGT